ncbi:MAG: thermonuclease family protein [Pyrinomonadaceae bacterium]
MIFRAVALSLALLIGIGVLIPLATNYAEASARKHENKKKYKKYSKKWWLTHHARVRKRKALEARNRALRLRRLRLANAGMVSTQTNKQKVADIASTNQIEQLFIIIEGKVKNVYSGDNINIENKDGKVYLIRMLGIDAPEIKQEFGDKSQKKLSDLILGKDVTVIVRRRDSSNRYFGTVYFGGKDVNFNQIETGMARYFQENGYEAREDDCKIYEQAEQKSRIERNGLWGRQKSDVARGFQRR